eukprot:Sdes_comp20576_c0_seq1m15480
MPPTSQSFFPDHEDTDWTGFEPVTIICWVLFYIKWVNYRLFQTVSPIACFWVDGGLSSFWNLMHPPLDLHLHSEECQVIIKEFTACHEANFYNRFIGACNKLRNKVDKCLYKEYVQARRHNQKLGEERKERLNIKLKEMNGEI